MASIRSSDGHAHRFLRRGQDDGGAGARDTELVFQFCREQVIEILSAAAADLEEVIVVTGNVVALGNLVQLGDGAKECSAVAVAGKRYGDIGGERVTYQCRVDQ